jgi:hypothetical protein
MRRFAGVAAAGILAAMSDTPTSAPLGSGDDTPKAQARDAALPRDPLRIPGAQMPLYQEARRSAINAALAHSAVERERAKVAAMLESFTNRHQQLAEQVEQHRQTANAADQQLQELSRSLLLDMGLDLQDKTYNIDDNGHITQVR